MKAISIRQPWAWLIINGHKDIENRTWRKRYPGSALIHASQKMDAFPRKFYTLFPTMPEPEDFEHGVVVGRVRIVACVSDSDSPWFEGPFGYVLADPVKCVPKKLRGQLGFFNTGLGVLDLIWEVTS